MAKSKKKIQSLDDLTPDPANVNKGSERGHFQLDWSLTELGAGRSILADADGIVLAGNKTLEVAADHGLPVRVVETDGRELVVVQRTDLRLQGEGEERTKARQLAIADNRVSETSYTVDVETLLAHAQTVDISALYRQDEIDALLASLEPELPAPGGGGDEFDATPEETQTRVRRGDLWELGNHRLLCGDSTKAEDVARVMGGEKAVLCHADPPYGMGKEADGVVNDNLYADKLDAFQMQWWKAFRPHLEDNASAYIWGNAEDLWRLWYVGGLRDSERFTFRNEIVWDKGGGGFGVGTEAQRCYFPEERCLFFMLGEQGFNNNADNYWDGWEGIRSQLEADCKKMGWGAKDIERICGVGMYSHWFTKSQWTFIPEEHYKKLQAAAREHDAFKREHDELKREHDELKREHDELKREFYATRAYFNNTHDNMTDVWSFGRVTGAERHGHATPKPVAMIERAIKSSAADGGIVAEPFGGSGTTLIACERTNRKARVIEIEPKYCNVILSRWEAETGRQAKLLERADAK